MEAGCWHSHSHEGKGRAVWLDALDAPLHQHFNTVVFEPGPSNFPDNDPPPQIDGRAYESGGILPDAAATDQPYSPIFKYPLEKVIETLSQMPAAADGSKRVRYTSPLTGGAAMPGIDCYMLAPATGTETRPYRTNANMVCLAVEGDGVSHVGETEMKWQKNDIFSLPRHHWISHRATSTDAKLLQLTDRETLLKLDYLNEEYQD